MPQSDLPMTRAERDAAFEAARVESLLAFASLTADQKLQWLTDMLELVRSVRPDFSAKPDDPATAR